jgi:hypothetical protein
MASSEFAHQLPGLIETVQHNCHVSDAQYAGNYTMCIYLLKMREYFRWEQGIPLSGDVPREQVGPWLVEREHHWERLENAALKPLQIDDTVYDPFDLDDINAVLIPEGRVYSGGTGLYNKPHFFLADLLHEEQAGNIRILVSGREYARDLVAPPSMFRDNTVFVRQESLRRFLWERIEDWRFQKSRTDQPMGRAMATYGVDRDLERVLDEMTNNETESLILHEVGEAQVGDLLGEDWRAMLASFPRSKAEFLARAVRDLLADSLVTLPTLLDDGNEPALHVYFSNFSGMRKHLAPTLSAAYGTWADSGNMKPLGDTVRRGCHHWREKAEQALSLFRQRGVDGTTDIVKLLENAAF